MIATAPLIASALVVLRELRPDLRPEKPEAPQARSARDGALRGGR